MRNKQANKKQLCRGAHEGSTPPGPNPLRPRAQTGHGGAGRVCLAEESNKALYAFSDPSLVRFDRGRKRSKPVPPAPRCGAERE